MTKRTKILLRSYAKLIPIMDFCGFESKMMGIILKVGLLALELLALGLVLTLRLSQTNIKAD